MAKKRRKLRFDENVDLILLKTERMLAVMATLFMLILCSISVFVDMDNKLSGVLFICGILMFYMAAKRCIRTEKINGRYRCRSCGHVYHPSYKNPLRILSVPRNRLFVCHECGKQSWHEKVKRNYIPYSNLDIDAEFEADDIND